MNKILKLPEDSTRRPDLERFVLRHVHNYARHCYESGEQHEALLFSNHMHISKKILTDLLESIISWEELKDEEVPHDYEEMIVAVGRNNLRQQIRNRLIKELS